MKTVLFINFPVSGHVNPQRALCGELASRDIRLIYMTADRYKDRYEKIDNLEILTYPQEFMDYYDELEKQSELSIKFMALCYVFYTLTEHVLEFTMKKVGEIQPDFIICDTLAEWGKIAARYYNIPHAFFFSSLMGDRTFMKNSPVMLMGMLKSAVFDSKYLFEQRKIRKRIESRYGKVVDPMPEIMSDQGQFSMVYTSRKFHPGGEEYGENVHFIRPAVYNEMPVNKKRDTIFISVGTISYSENFWDVCAEATKDLGYRIVMTFGNNKKNKVKEENLHSNIELYDNLTLNRFREELERSEVFITHGGFNSISDAIVAETKMLVCPVTTENRNNGKIIENYGCGRLFPGKKVTAAQIKSELQKLIAKDCRDALKEQKESFIKEKTCKDAVNALNQKFELF